MQYQFFTIPIKNLEDAQDELNGFLRSHKVLTVSKELIAQGDDSFWTVAVEYLDGSPSSKASQQSSRKRIDYKEVLPEDQFAAFSKLREVRKSLAERDGVPVYAVFTNEQLAEIVRRDISSVSDIAKIDGIGEAKITKYAEPIFSSLKSTQ